MKRIRLVFWAVAVMGSGCSEDLFRSSRTAPGGRVESFVSLEGAQILDMTLGLVGGGVGLCPGAPIQVSIQASVQLPGKAEPLRVRTWAGNTCVEKSAQIEFSAFQLSGGPGSFSATGWFLPSADVVDSAADGFLLKAERQGMQVSTQFSPDYGCIRGGGNRGSSGSDGMRGNRGSSGSSGGGAGGAGGAGSAGGEGQAGPRYTVAATLVKTPFHGRLLALVFSGDTRGVLLAPADAPFELTAGGGRGGNGGTGGEGGSGGSGSGSDGPGGAGGSGGPGGNGGNGGRGGTIDLQYESRFPELATQLMLTASGGSGGSAGDGGSGGSGGSGSPSGVNGTSGTRGVGGSSGPAGSTSSRAADVRAQFMGLSGITPLP